MKWLLVAPVFGRRGCGYSDAAFSSFAEDSAAGAAAQRSLRAGRALNEARGRTRSNSSAAEGQEKLPILFTMGPQVILKMAEPMRRRANSFDGGFEDDNEFNPCEMEKTRHKLERDDVLTKVDNDISEEAEDEVEQMEKKVSKQKIKDREEFDTTNDEYKDERFKLEDEIKSDKLVEKAGAKRAETLQGKSFQVISNSLRGLDDRISGVRKAGPRFFSGMKSKAKESERSAKKLFKTAGREAHMAMAAAKENTKELADSTSKGIEDLVSKQASKMGESVKGLLDKEKDLNDEASKDDKPKKGDREGPALKPFLIRKGDQVLQSKGFSS